MPELLRADRKGVQPVEPAEPRLAEVRPSACGPPATEPRPGEWLAGESRSAISDAIVTVYRRFSGRGPTKIKTRVDGNRLLTVMEDFLTPLERTLVELGREELVRTLRHSLRANISAHLRRATEDRTGRRVLAHLGAVHLRPELAIELFELEPLDDERASEGRR